MDRGFGRGSGARRALNIVWTAAGSYDFMPDFLAFHRDGTPDIYLNSIIGLAHRFYDEKMLNEFVRELDKSLLREIFTDILWLGIESAVYERELKNRPVLAELRQEHAKIFLQDEIDLSMQQLMMRSELVHSLKAGRCREILGKDCGIKNPWEIRLYRALNYEGELDTKEIITRTTAIIDKFFVFRLNDITHHALHLSLGTRLNALMRKILPMERRQVDDICRINKPVIVNGEQAGGALTDIIGYSSKAHSAKALAEICARFGEPLYSESKRLLIEQEFCTGNHQNAHLYFARGSKNSSVYAANKNYFASKQQKYRLVIRKLSSRLRSALAVYHQPVPIRAKTGNFKAGLVWQALLLNDARVFTTSYEENHAEFAVTLLLDASESRAAQSALIAAQAYAIVSALIAVGIKVQVLSFCSLKGYTVFSELKGFAAENAAGVFSYQTAGWNRDGLALRAVSAMLPDDGKKQVVLVLTDAHPSDDLDLPLMGNSIGRQYMGKIAVEDAKNGATELKNTGVKLIGLINSVVAGEADDAAKKIYGNSCARIEKIDSLASIVAIKLEKQIDSIK